MALKLRVPLLTRRDIGIIAREAVFDVDSNYRIAGEIRIEDHATGRGVQVTAADKWALQEVAARAQHAKTSGNGSTGGIIDLVGEIINNEGPGIITWLDNLVNNRPVTYNLGSTEVMVPEWLVLYTLNAFSHKNPEMIIPYGIDTPLGKIQLSAVQFLKTYARDGSARPDRSFDYLRSKKTLDELVLANEKNDVPPPQAVPKQTMYNWEKGRMPKGMQGLLELSEQFGISLPLPASDARFQSVLNLATYVFFSGRIKEGNAIELTVPDWVRVNKKKPLAGLDPRFRDFHAEVVTYDSKRFIKMKRQGTAALARLVSTMGIPTEGYHTLHQNYVLQPVSEAMRMVSNGVKDVGLEIMIEDYFGIWAMLRGKVEKKHFEISFIGDRLPIPKSHASGSYLKQLEEFEPENPGFREHVRLVRHLFPDSRITTKYGRMPNTGGETPYYTRAQRISIMDLDAVFRRFPQLMVHQERSAKAA